MKILKQVINVIVLLSMVLLLSGCWNNRPITSLAIVVGIGFDKAPDGNILLTAQVVIPSKLSGQGAGSGGSGSGQQSGGGAEINVSAKGETSFDAARDLITELNRKAYFAQVQLLVVSEAIAKNGLDEIWDFLERDNEFSRTMRVIIVKDSTAKALLEARPSIDKLNAIEITDTLDSNVAFGKSVEIQSFQLTELLSRPLTGIVLGTIDTKDSDDLTKMDLEGSAVLKHGALIGYFTPNQTRGYLFATNKIKSTILVIPNPEEKNKKISLEVIRSTGKIDARIEKAKPILSINVKAFGNLGDEQGGVDLFNDKDIKKIEDEAAALIADNVNSAVSVSQKDFDSDIFNFNELLYANYYSDFQKESKNWDALYRNAKVHIVAQFHFDRPGLIKKPAYTQ